MNNFLIIDAAAGGTSGGGRPFPPESGPVTIHGPRWTANGKPWFWRGCTMFLLLERLMNGEDITPEIAWMVGKGINVARVFVAGVPWQGHRWLYEAGDWSAQLAKLAGMLNGAGIRLEATVCTDQGDDPRWVPILQQVYDTLKPCWAMCFVEYVNEPWVQGDGLTVAGVDGYDILSAFGLQPPFGETGAIDMLDYGTVHLPRDLDHFPRNSKDLLELQNSNGAPWVSDEPLGIAEYDKQGAGARTTNRLAVAGHFAIAALFGGGATIHSQCGLEGRRPSASEPITESLAQTVSDVWQFIPAEMPTGDYSRAGLASFPLLFDVNGTSSQLSSQHAYASILGDLAYAVVPMPAPGFVAEGINGWRVDAELLPGIVRLTR